MTTDDPTAADGWNARRLALIDGKYTGGLTPGEQAELDGLNRLADAVRAAATPPLSLSAAERAAVLFAAAFEGERGARS